MPRRPRDVSSGLHHVWVNATDHWPLFLDDADRMVWLRRFVRLLDEYGWACLALCQMNTHVHAIVAVPDRSLPVGMRDLNRDYVRAFNDIHGRIGTLQRKRFGSRRVRDGADLVGVFVYVVCNPVEAGLCRRPEDWFWSSYRTTVGLGSDFPFVDASLVAAEAGGLAALQGATDTRAERLVGRAQAVG